MEVKYKLLEPMSAFLGDNEAGVDHDSDGDVDEEVPIVEGVSFVHWRSNRVGMWRIRCT